MAEIEDKVATNIVGDLDNSDDATAVAAVAVADFVPLHGGDGTINTTNYGPGTAPMGGGWDGQHDGAGTEPMPAGFNVPADNATDLSRIRAGVRASQAATAESLKSFATGHVKPAGRVSGLGNPTNERTKL